MKNLSMKEGSRKKTPKTPKKKPRRSWRSSLSQLWSIRAISTCSFFFSTAIFAFGILFISLIFVYRSITRVTSNTCLLTNGIVDNFLHTWLGQGEAICDAMEGYLKWKQHELDLEFRNHTSVDYMHMYFYLEALKYENINDVGLGTEHGVTVFYSVINGLLGWSNELHMDNPCCNYTVDHQPEPLYVRVVLEDSEGFSFGNYFHLSDTPYDYRLVENGWYAETMKSDNYTWTSYLTTGSFELNTSFGRKFYINGKFVGVLGVTFGMKNFADFLNKLLAERLGNIGEIFVVDDQGFLLATTVDTNLFVLPDSIELSMKIERVRPEASENDLIRQTAQKILKNNEKWTEVPATTAPLTLNDRVISIVKPYVSGLSLVVVHTVPTSIVYKEMINMSIVSVFVFLGLSALFVVVCLVSIVVVTRPLLLLVDEMEKVHRLDLDAISVRKSSLFEVSTLQNAFMFTVEKLKEYKSFLPLSLVEEHEEDKDIDLLLGEKESEEVDEDECDDPNSVEKKSNDSGGSDTSSGVLSAIASQYGEGENLFELNLKNKNRILGLIKIIGIKDMLKLGEKDALVNFSGEFYEEIVNLIGELNDVGVWMKEYALDNFSITFSRGKPMLHFCERLVNSILPTIIEKYPLLKVKIGLISGKLWEGNIGCQSLKKKVLWGEGYNLINMVLNKPELKKKCRKPKKKSPKPKRIEILCGDGVTNFLPQRYITKPIQVYEDCDDRDIIVISRIEKILGVEEDYNIQLDEYYALREAVKMFQGSVESYTNREKNVCEELANDSLKKYLKKTQDLEVSMFGFNYKAALEKKKMKSKEVGPKNIPNK